MKKTKFPIILVHGIILKDISFFKAFGRIEKHLRSEGYTVYSSRIDGIGSTETNAAALKEEVLRILEETSSEKINIIAHSKGGLDSKRMINELGMDDKVASLTTLATPHKGSPIATNILRLPNFILDFIAFWLNFWYRIFGDKHPDALKVCEELQSKGSIEEETFGFTSKVYCQSYSTTLKSGRDDFIMGIPLMFYKFFESTSSDGLVSEESSRFASYKGKCLNESVSHTEIVDFMVKKNKREKILTFYSSLAKELSDMGF